MMADPHDPYPPPYGPEVESHLNSLHPGLAYDLGLVDYLAPDDADSLIYYLLELACQCQNIGNIVLGRRLLCRLPRSWLLGRIERVAENRLPLDDPWEYTRLLEVYLSLYTELCRRTALSRRESRDPEIREAAGDFLAAIDKTTNRE